MNATGRVGRTMPGGGLKMPGVGKSLAQLIPVRVMARYMENPFMRVATALFGGFLIREVPFRDLYFLDDARQFLKTVRLPLIYVGGIKSLGSIEKVLSEGFSFVQIARALVHDPGFIGKLARILAMCSEGLNVIVCMLVDTLYRVSMRAKDYLAE